MADDVTYAQAISDSIVDAMNRSPRVLLMGEGVTDPKGVFGTCLEAHRLFPGRVIETPLSETMLTGACIGLALEGFIPIYVHARFDFALFTFEHIINVAAKMAWLTGERLPMVLRVVVGRGWGQGPTHGQNFAAALGNVPGLRVLMPVTPQGYARAMRGALLDSVPTIIVEHRRLYSTSLRWEKEFFPPALGMNFFSWGNFLQWADVQIFALGDSAIEAREAARVLADSGLTVRVVDVESVRLPSPVRDAGLNVFVENAAGPFSVARGLALEMADKFGKSALVISPPSEPLPSSKPLEDAWYVKTDDIVRAVCQRLNRASPPSPASTSPAEIYRGAF